MKEENLPRIQQEIGYIFKKDDYSYEEEFRILIESNYESNNIEVKAEEHQVLGHNIPGLFCYLDLEKDDKQNLYKIVTINPKKKNKSLVRLYLDLNQ